MMKKQSPSQLHTVTPQTTSYVFVMCYVVHHARGLHEKVETCAHTHRPHSSISIYNLVELKSFVRKLLTQFARDRRETRDHYRAPHGDGYKGVDGR